MTSKVTFRQTSSNIKEPLLDEHPSNGATTSCGPFKETAGSTTAGCAALLCCCPLGLANLALFAAYRLPAGLYRRVQRQRRRRKLMKQGLLLPQRKKKCRCGFGDTESETQLHPVDREIELRESDSGYSEEVEKKVMELEMEMWEKFYGGGFWRSPSQMQSEEKIEKL